MRRIIPFNFCLAVFLIAISIQSQAAGPRLYAVIFGVTINEAGELQSLRVVKVIDPETSPDAAVNVPVPSSYIAAARELVLKKKYPPHLKNGDPVEFFTYFFYDPFQPGRADIDPHKSSDSAA